MSPSSPGLSRQLDPLKTGVPSSDYLTLNDVAGHRELPRNDGKISFSTGDWPVTPSDPSGLHLVSTTSVEPLSLSRSRTIPVVVLPEPKKSFRWRSRLGGSKKESKISEDSSSLPSTTLEAQRLEEISLKSLVSGQNVAKGKSSKTVNVYLSQNSTYALFWTQASINIWDVGMSPPTLVRAITTESSVVLATVTKVYLAYIIGTRDQKLTVSDLRAFDSHLAYLRSSVLSILYIRRSL